MTKSDDKAPRPLKNASILVVEDHIFVLDLLERMLKPRVGGLHGARSGEDAFYNLEKTPGLAHVAIVDYHLLGMDGVKFLEKRRTSKNKSLKNLPVIMSPATTTWTSTAAPRVSASRAISRNRWRRICWWKPLKARLLADVCQCRASTRKPALPSERALAKPV